MPLCSRCSAPTEAAGGGGRPAPYLFAAWLAWLLVTLLALRQSAQLYSFYLQQARLPLCDAAINGFQGYLLTCDLRSGHLWQFVLDLVRQEWWPFGFSLLLVPFQLAADWAGISIYDASTLMVTACYGLLPIAILWTARQLDSGASGLWAGVIAAVMFLFAPLHQLYAILIMREISGALCSTVAVGLYLRARRLSTLGAYRLAGAGLLAVFFIKFNFGLLLAIPLMLVEFLALNPQQQAGLLHATLKWVRLLADLRRPRWARLAVAAYLGAVLGWLLLGRNPADLLYPGLIVASGLLGIRLFLRRADIPARIARLGIPGRAWLETVVAPLWLWFLIPWHLQNFVSYLHLAPRARGVLENYNLPKGLLLYLETILHGITPFPAAGVCVLAALLAAVLWFRYLPGAQRWFMIIVLAELLLVILHPSDDKNPRFLINNAPMLLLAAGMAAAQFATWLGRKTPWLKHGLLLAVAAVVAGMLYGGAGPGAGLHAAYRANTAEPAIRSGLHLAAGMPDWRKRTAIIGGFNQASASLIAWEVQQRSPHAILDLVDFPRWVVRSHPADDAKLWVGDWMCAKGVEQIVAIRLLPDCPWRSDPDYLAFNAWQLGVIDAVEASPRWAPVRRARVAELALEIILFAPAHQRDAAGTPRSADGK